MTSSQMWEVDAQETFFLRGEKVHRIKADMMDDTPDITLQEK